MVPIRPFPPREGEDSMSLIDRRVGRRCVLGAGALGLLLAACGAPPVPTATTAPAKPAAPEPTKPAAAPAATTAPAPAATTAPAPAAAAKPTEAPKPAAAAPAASGQAIKLTKMAWGS